MAAMMQMPTLNLSSVHDEKTVFNKMNHPTYVADLQKVSKFVPVSSYASLSTMAGSVADVDTMSLAGTQMSAMRERKNSLTESENSAATGTTKKSERSAFLKSRGGLLPAETAAPLSPRSALQQKQIGEYNLKVQKRTELVAKLGKGEEYKIKKLVNLEKNLGSRLDTIQEYDYWAHADYDADATALNRSTSAVNQMQKKLMGAADASTDDGSSDTDMSMPLLENEVATDFWATHDYDEDFGAHNKSSADLHKEHEEQMVLRGISASINNKVVVEEVVALGTPNKGLRRIPSSEEVAIKMKLVDMALEQNRDAFFVDTSYESYDVSKDDFWASHDYDEDFGMHNNHAATLKEDHDATLNVLAQQDGYNATTAAYTNFYAAKSDVEKVRAHETWAYFRVTKDELADAENMNSWAHMDYDDDFGMHCMVSGHN